MGAAAPVLLLSLRRHGGRLSGAPAAAAAAASMCPCRYIDAVPDGLCWHVPGVVGEAHPHVALEACGLQGDAAQQCCHLHDSIEREGLVPVLHGLQHGCNHTQQATPGEMGVVYVGRGFCERQQMQAVCGPLQREWCGVVWHPKNAVSMLWPPLGASSSPALPPHLPQVCHAGELWVVARCQGEAPG